MQQKTYSLLHGKTIHRWLVSEVAEEEQTFPPVRFSYAGNLNDWLVKGFSIFENPARAAFVQSRRLRQCVMPQLDMPLPGAVFQDEAGRQRTWMIHLPWDNPSVESSGFWRRPTLLMRWAYTLVHSEKAQTVKLKISTCGGLVIWINGSMVRRFEPYTRNIESSMLLEVELKEGENAFLIYLEDLAERDTLFKFRIDVQAGAPLHIVLPCGAVDGARLDQLERAFAAAYFPADTIRSGNVELCIENPLDEDLDVLVEYQVERGKPYRQVVRWPAHADRLRPGTVDDFECGVNFVRVTLAENGVLLQKIWPVQIHQQRWLDMRGKDLAERKRVLLSQIARYGRNDAHRAYALMHLGGDYCTIERILDAELQSIDRRDDCSDFSLIMLFRLLQEVESRLQWRGLCERIKRSIVYYRYWFDEPGDDVMWFFSENHALLFHACERLAGEFLPSEMFPNAGLTGRQHAELAKQRLLAWFERFEAEGLAEWNSAPYFPIDIMGLLELRDLTNDMELREKAQYALDTIFVHLGANSFAGALSTSQGRTYDKELRGNACNAATALLWVAAGKGVANASTFGVVSFCASNYRPPEQLLSLVELASDECLVYQCHQGPPEHANLYTFKSAGCLLATAPEFRPGMHGYSEHILHAAVGREALVWVNHPGELEQVGSGRPGYWAGNGSLPRVAQYQDLAVALYQIGPEFEIDFTHAYFPTFAFDEVASIDGWWFGHCDSGYIGLWAANGLTVTESGPARGRELISQGRGNTWIVRVGDVYRHGSFRAFIDVCIALSPQGEAGRRLFLRDRNLGAVTYGWNEPLMVDGIPIKYESSSVVPAITVFKGRRTW